ncbi:hypothetical protein [Cryptosporangium aurantiacum]|uniref:ATP/GTP-binding protein n=1 Tax=Cryptosporangium aurantiacum TaxID=134849 RepID=A0A1M7R8R6_9ACTN|nr:hypothetical protein [Cryptosporangium aurantiacum]SHN42714.1 hypothetical protein SAMN05443668_108321 [Cryptosporangium aurantiacum]
MHPGKAVRAAAMLAVAAVGYATLGGPAVAEPPPSGGATCPPGEDCEVRAEQPGTGPRPRPEPGDPDPGPGPTGPPERACNNPVFCPPGEAQPEPEGETAQQVALREFAKLPIRGPQIGVAPDPEGSGLVGLPVWLWTDVTPLTWGPYTATAAVPGLTVTATATATRITWNMGDGRQVVCDNPGTPYRPSYGNAASPDCGYRYARSSRSQPGGTYTITGTTNWVVNWAGGGQSGTIPQTRQTQIQVRIDELQVVTQ